MGALTRLQGKGLPPPGGEKRVIEEEKRVFRTWLRGFEQNNVKKVYLGRERRGGLLSGGRSTRRISSPTTVKGCCFRKVGDKVWGGELPFFAGEGGRDVERREGGAPHHLTTAESRGGVGLDYCGRGRFSGGKGGRSRLLPS